MIFILTALDSFFPSNVRSVIPETMPCGLAFDSEGTSWKELPSPSCTFQIGI